VSSSVCMSRAEARPGRPCVGIFWRVPDGPGTAVVIDSRLLAAAEHYGDFLTHAQGHCEVWETWQRLGPAGLAQRGLPDAIAWHEYDEFPRGRIVFQKRERLFVIYADRKLQTPRMTARIVGAFELAGHRTAVRSDAHYCT
jgi:hypothetical protein